MTLKSQLKINLIFNELIESITVVGYVYTYKLFGGYIPVFKIEEHCTGLPVQSYFSQLISKIWVF